MLLLDLHELTTDEQLTRLREGKLDAAVVRHPADTVGLESGPVVDTPLASCSPHRTPWPAPMRFGYVILPNTHW